MRVNARRFRAFVFLAGLATLACAGAVSADPPSRVARLGHLNGAVSFSPAGESDWVQATINRPLAPGDRLWTESRARAEIQVGGAMIRLNAGTGVSILNLDDRIAQLQLTQGTLNVRVLRLAPGQSFEVDTPNLAFTLRQPGAYRIEVDPDGNATTIVVRKGQGDVYGEGAAYVVDSRQPYRFTGTDLREYSYVDAPRVDDFDRWSNDRDRSYDNSGSARYVSPDVVGYQDLDANGTWRVDARYGSVWVPNRVAAGWAPYRDGHWAWVDPWGWTWVDDAPWGFAVSHYGRWANLRGTWGWVPGPVRTRAYYAPALVAFLSGSNFQLAISGGNVGGVAWFPLGPREIYRPSYPVSRGYFQNINSSNTVIDNTVVKNYYSNTNVTNVLYANRQVPGAVVAVPTTTFVQSQPVSRATVRVSREMIVGGSVAFVPSVAPTERSVHGAAAQGGKPPSRVFERPVVARTAPPAAHAGFAAQQPQLAAQPGKPLDDAARKQSSPAEAPTAPVVKVIAQTPKAPPTLRPPPMAPETKSVDARGKTDRQGPPSATVPSAPTAVPAQGKASPPPAPAAKAPPPRSIAGQRDPVEQRGPSATAPAATAPRAAPPPAPPARPEVAAPPSAGQPRGQRGQVESRGGGKAREGTVAPPTAVPAKAPPVTLVLPQAAPAAPATQRPPQRAAPPGKPQPPSASPPEAAATPPAQRVRPESAPAARKAAPPAAAPEPASRPPQAAPQPAPPNQMRTPAPAVAGDKKKGGDEQLRDQEERKPKG